MKKTVLAALACSLICLADLASAKMLAYEPSAVAVEGVITSEKHFGPPGFGETPAQDQQFDVPVLVLDHAVTVMPKAGATMNTTAYKDVAKLQMVGFSLDDLKAHAGQHATVSGTLFQRESAEHYTSVLITVKKVRYKK